MKYTVDYFINKFEAIPEKDWCVLGRAKNGYQRCALGWCYPSYRAAMQSETSFGEENDEASDLLSLVRLLNPLYGVGGINNGLYLNYQQPTPKQRILAALYDVKAMQQPIQTDRIRYVAVAEEVKEMEVCHN